MPALFLAMTMLLWASNLVSAKSAPWRMNQDSYVSLPYGYYTFTNIATNQSLTSHNDEGGPILSFSNLTQGWFEIQPHNQSTPFARIRADSTANCMTVTRIAMSASLEDMFRGGMTGCNVDPQVVKGISPVKQLWTFKPVTTATAGSNGLYEILTTQNPIGGSAPLALARCPSSTNGNITCLRRYKSNNPDFQWSIQSQAS